jgi:sterol desaturase/sphingolipid hydroxylase (fatty acid hydroxylase superfamily)
VDKLLQQYLDVAPRILALLIDPFVQILFRGSLFWWPYLAISLGVALCVFVAGREGGRAALGEFRRRYLTRDLWAHPSSQADYAYYIVNSVLYPILVAPLIVSGAAIAASVHAGLDHAFGSPAAPAMSLGVARTVYTILFFVAYDFGRYVGHSLLHDVPLLWPFHKPHHSAEVLTPFTNFRAHPVELFVMGAAPNAATGLVSGILWYAMAGEIGFYTFLGLHVSIAAFNTIANLRHSPVWISFGPVLNRWLISPAHHQIHHSREARHFGKNRGFELAIWDRLFGTLYLPVRGEAFGFGLDDGSEPSWHSVGRLYGWPFRYALAHLGWGTAPSAPEIDTRG